MPGWYSDMKGAAFAGVPWVEFATYPLIAKNLVFAAITAESQAQKDQQPPAT